MPTYAELEALRAEQGDLPAQDVEQKKAPTLGDLEALRKEQGDFAKARGEYYQQAFGQDAQSDVMSETMGGVQKVLQGALLGYGDEATAAIAAPFIAATTDRTIEEAYSEALDLARATMKQYEDVAGKVPSAALEVSGALSAPVTGGLKVVEGITKGGGLLPKAFAGGALGATEAAIYGSGVADGDMESRVSGARSEAPLGAVIGAGAPAVLPLVRSYLQPVIDVVDADLGGKARDVIDWIGSRFSSASDTPMYNDQGQLSDEALQLITEIAESGDPAMIDRQFKRQLAADGVLTPEQAERFNLFKKYDLDPLRAQVTQKGEDWIELQEASKGSGEVSERISRQEEQITGIGRGLEERLSPVTFDEPSTGSQMYQVAEDVVMQQDQVVQNAYNTARQLADQRKIVKLDDSIKKLRSLAGKDNAAGGVLSAFKTELINRGVMDKGFKRVGRIDVETSEAIRQELNRLSAGANPYGKQLIAELKNTLDDDVSLAVGDDVFADARAARVKFSELLEKQRKSKFDKSGTSLFEKIIYNQVPEEKVVSAITRGRKDDLLKIKDFYLNESGEAGQIAWNNFKAQVLRDAVDKATSTQGKAENATRVFNINKFKAPIANLKKSGKYDLIFEPEEIEVIEDIIDIGTLRVPKQGTFTGKGPSAQGMADANEWLYRAISEQLPRRSMLSFLTGLIRRADEAVKGGVPEAKKQRNILKRQLDPVAETEKAVMRGQRERR